MRTMGEFRAEVYRRKEEVLKRRRARLKKIINTLICLPFAAVVAFMGISLGIAMMPAGADKNASSPTFGEGAESKVARITVEQGSESAELLREFFSGIEARTPESDYYDYSSDMGKSGYEVSLGGEIYFVCESYIKAKRQYFKITEADFARFLDIIGEAGNEE
ncbi:MAG: hypothetical protein IJX27_02520 [Clostridia bacterium]|nr:hypothetical protein [Clostridia bacterium]